MSVMRRICLLLLCLAVCACVLPAAFAEEGGELITAFADLGEDAVVETEFQYALIELEKLFPRQITVYCGDEARSIDVSWKCLENYSERRDEYHFAPRLDGYRVSSEAKPPQITVVVLGEWEIPPLLTIPSADDHVPPILGAPGAEKALPASYNAYERNLLPPIRNQNPYGTCWAHATIGAIEADLIRDGNAGTDIDLSELHLVYYYNHNYYDEKGCNAGDSIVLNDGNYIRNGSIDAAANLLVNQVGPAAEADVPYYLNYDYNPGPADGRALNAVQVTGVYKMNIDDRAAVKNAIMKHGAVTTTYYADQGECYDATYNSYYSTAQTLNHAVLLVGWDDNFSRNHFAGSTKPEGDGAWLVRNSWGYEGYGLSGYFWLSYYDVSLHTEAKAIAFDAQSWTYDHCYAYDASLADGYFSFNFSGALEESFQVDGGEAVCAVGIGTWDADLNLEVTVSCGGESVSGSVMATYPGLYMVALSEPLRIESRSPVLVTVARDAGGFNVLFEISSWTRDYTGATLASWNQSCGSGGFSYGGYAVSYDARVKLFTMDTEWIPDLILPAELTTIGEGAFAGGAFTYVRLSEKTASIGKNAFANCPNLAYIYIPTATRSIDAQAFGSSEGLTVLGHTGSYAETYAEDHGFTFMPVA